MDATAACLFDDPLPVGSSPQQAKPTHTPPPYWARFVAPPRVAVIHHHPSVIATPDAARPTLWHRDHLGDVQGAAPVTNFFVARNTTRIEALPRTRQCV